MTKRILAVLVALLLAGTVGVLAGCGGELPKNSVAKVGSTLITQEQLDQRVTEFEAQYLNTGQIPDKATQPEEYKKFQQDVLEYMIVYELAQQKAKDLKVSVTDEDVQKEIDSIKETSFGGDQAQFDEALKAQGMTIEQLKKSYKESMLLQKVYEEATKDVTEVPDSELQAYYDAHESDYFVEETRTARHILVAPDPNRVNGTTTTSTTSSTTSTTQATATTGSSTGSSTDDASSTTVGGVSTTTSLGTTPTTAAPTTTTTLTQKNWDDALATASKVRADLAGGADWTAEAKQYSDDPGSKERGGDLGTVYRNQMVKEFEDSVFSLQKDEISQPIKTTYGYHIIQVTDISPAKQYTLDEVKEEIKSELLGKKKSDAWVKWIDDQKKVIGVTYGDGWQPAPTTTSTSATSTTAATGETTVTTAAPASTTTTAGASITTAAPTTTNSSTQ